MPRRTFLSLALLLPLCASARAAEPDFQPVDGFVQLADGRKLGACSAVAVSPQGEVFLFHRGKHPVLCLDAAGKPLRHWGDGEIESAHGMRFDPEGNLWLTDVGGHRVFKFDTRGKLLLTLGTGKPGDGADQFNKPTDIAFGADGDLFISDGYGNSRVMKFNARGQFIKSWGQAGKGRGEFNLPHSIVVDAQGRVLVGDRENDRIQIFDQEGKLLDVWPGFAPFGLAFDPAGELYVADGRAHNVLRLDAKGKVVQRWGSKGSDPGQFQMPHMLSFDRAGDLFVAEINGKRLQKLVRAR